MKKQKEGCAKGPSLPPLCAISDRARHAESGDMLTNRDQKVLWKAP